MKPPLKNQTLLNLLLLFYALHIDCMEHQRFLHPLEVKPSQRALSLQAKRFNYNNPFIAFSDQKDFNTLLSYCDEHGVRDTNTLHQRISCFLALSTTCKEMNALLSLKKIGALCQGYNFPDKNKLLEKVMFGIPKEDTSIARLTAMVLLHAGADANLIKVVCKPAGITYSPLGTAIAQKDLRLIKLLLSCDANPNFYISHMPTFFNAPNRTIAQLLIKGGADVRSRNARTNVLWHIVEKGKALPARLISFYIRHGVNPRVLRKKDDACDDTNHGTYRNNDDACILHHLAYQTYPRVLDAHNFLKKCTLLLTAIPDMVNTLDKNNKTPLDIALERVCDNLTPKVIKKFIKLLLTYGAKTAEELRKSSVIQAKTSSRCILCLGQYTKLIKLPCATRHTENECVCVCCHHKVLNLSDRCPICKHLLKK